MSGEVPGNSGFDPQTISGAGGIQISGAGHVVVDGADIIPSGGGVTPFRYIPLGSNNGAPAVPADILVVPGGIVMTTAGRIMLDFDATIQVTPPAGTGALDTCGPIVSFLVDGVARPEFAFFQLVVGNAGTAFDSFAAVVRLRAVFQLAAGTHTCSVQWNNIQPATPSTLDTFAGGGGLSVEVK